MQKVVLVDEATNRSAPLPEDFFSGVTVPFRSDLSTLFSPIIAEKSPSGSYQSAAEVQPSDTDILNHTTQTTYMKFALDGIAKAARKGLLSGIKDDVCFYRGHTASILHLGESFAGDVLTVKIWENKDKPLQIHCVIERERKDICYAEVSFYPSEATRAIPTKL